MDGGKKGEVQRSKPDRSNRRDAATKGLKGLEIVRRCDRHHFVVLLKRWIVERALGWISRNRRLARGDRRSARGHFERHCRIATVVVRMQ